MNNWQPYRESFRRTATRTLAIAMVVAALVAPSAGGFSRWPVLTLLFLWPSFGGHWVDLFFLNWLRPRLSHQPAVQRIARIGVWFAGGALIALGMKLTVQALFARPQIVWLTWIRGGAIFIAIELVAHGALTFRRRASFFNGLG
jgi:hypothetical protein